jgi:4-amino-4-deoxy-L-arabinose transferase-like glycosyltransferase
MIADKLKSNSYILYISVILIALFRLLLTVTIPLLDKTESRYAEIARIMQETNQWVVLQIDYGIPFWAKPPLSTWLSAASYFVFGVNEFAARFPSFFLSILLLIIAGKMAKKSGVSFYLPGFILLTMPEFLIHTGVVSTDTALEFCVAIMMISFWKTMKSNHKTYWNYLFFVALGLGLLTKGPIIMVLTFPPLFLWCCLDAQRFRQLFSKFSIIGGIIITAIIGIPWYYFAEQQSPGFLDYFIVGEHYKRFVEGRWAGDLYGSGHSQPKGMIWVFLFIFGLPWVQVVFYKFWKTIKKILKNDWVSFLVLWLFWTPLFFTLSNNILHTYTLPVIIPIMFLMVHWWEDFTRKKLLIRIALIFPVITFIAYMVLETGVFDKKMNTDKYILEDVLEKRENKDIPLYYWIERNYSTAFYTNGRAQKITNQNQLDSIFKTNKKIILVTLKRRQNEIPKKYIEQMVLVESNSKTTIFISK